MIVQIEVCGIEITVILNNQDAFIALEFAQVLSASVVVKAKHIMVEPYFSSAQRRAATLLQADFMDFEFCQQVTHRLSSLYGDGTEVFLEDKLLDSWVGA